MFLLNRKELESLRSHIGTSNWGGNRYLPMAFTEQGVAMLSSVLNSVTAIKVNIQIIRIFTRMREMVLTHKDILLKLKHLENKVGSHDRDIRKIFKYLNQFLLPAELVNRRMIGLQRRIGNNSLSFTPGFDKPNARKICLGSPCPGHQKDVPVPFHDLSTCYEENAQRGM
jgi:hypothetical protein